MKRMERLTPKLEDENEDEAPMEWNSYSLIDNTENLEAFVDCWFITWILS
jgi:hypothetical protein